MDSYLHSSAVNRHHYALTHKVENASSIQESDTAIWSEIERIRKEVERGLTDVKGELVILMYCHTAAVARSVTAADLEFALSPAVNLAATGRAVKDRRIGYNFCAQFMPSDHPLQLMLVNTVRKEIESDELARIVLALDFLISSPSQFLAPAVAPRLEVLLGHKSQNLRHRALLALRALDTLSNDISESYLAHHSSTIIRRITRAARDDRIRSDETGAVSALLVATRDLLKAGVLRSGDVISPILALLEKAILNLKQRSPRLVTPLLSTLQSSLIFQADSNEIPDDTLTNIAKCTIRVILAFANRPASPNVLQAFRLLGALPVRIIHPLFSPGSTNTPSPDLATSPAKKPKQRRHPVLVLRPLIVSRDPTERWTGLTCLNSLDVRLWAGLPFEDGGDSADLIPPVLDEWEVGAIMRGLSDSDQTIRKLTMEVLHKVDPQLVHAFLEQLLTPPPTASSATPQSKPIEALEVLSFLYPKDGAGFARGVSRVIDVTSKREQGGRKPATPAVNDKLVEGVILVVHDGDQAFRSAFADTLLEKIVRDLDTTSLVSPLAPATGPSTEAGQALKLDVGRVDPTIILLFATTVIDVSSKPRRAIEALLSLLPGRGAGIQEVVLLAALRLVPRLEQEADVRATKERVEEFAKTQVLSRHMRRRCELFVEFVQDIEVLRRLVDKTKTKSLPEFLQALLSHKPPSNSTPVGKAPLSPKASTLRKVGSPNPSSSRTITPEFSTISLTNSPALRYDAYAPPQSTPRRNRPAPQSPFRRESEIMSSPNDSPFVSRDLDEENQTRKGKQRAGHLQLDVSESANPNADLITLHAVESPFREETDLRTRSVDESDAVRHASDTSSPPFHTAVMTSPRLTQDGGDLAPGDADAIWSSFDSPEADPASSLGKQTLRGWCDRTPESVGNVLRGMDVGFVTQKVGLKHGAVTQEKEVFAFIPSSPDSPDTDVARAVVRLKPADDGSCLWMLRCVEFELRVRIRKLLDGEST
ncbi:adaptin amino-terminal region protein [Rhizoctonia solani 123E]|uniref:Adaptin amino-terminal region protein n=1 Tax=Rhizoctonia solani 123E TaxID=1423351 RepID=A0A074RI29_9AGAM|nr:adaptin amino-terminal region protein [Rhizoctonia solani 123E]